MATGRLGTADLAATTLTTLYTAPASTFSVVSVNICNRSTSTVSVRIAISSSATPGNDEYIEYDAEILSKNVLERTGLVLDSGKNIVIRASGASCSAVCYGIETATS